ncbi:GntR family transcriptional regulator [Streptomyces sp. S1D4-20]|uniref:GntR family transcriptional regulator n=1 Tax=Streptomyces sp. S1D4-20 TaxID=2594462 RepID=UPI0011659B16|nr:GntR family transcriptional regulator [Streptomyces sp. S1D4-20]QDN54144.1 GntR family transcriptional regulator [Streptomyces sp. S1D4-20]
MSGSNLRTAAAEDARTLRDRIASVLRGRIEDGTYPVGSVFPARRLFVEELGVSRSTIANACRALAEEGYLLCFPGRGRGTLVLDPLRPPTGPDVLARTNGDRQEMWSRPGSTQDTVDRIASEIRKRIADGTYSPGRRIPSVAQLAPEFSARTWLVREALAVLKEERLLYSQNPYGHFVDPDVSRARSTAALARQGAGASTVRHTCGDEPGGRLPFSQGGTGGVR